MSEDLSRWIDLIQQVNEGKLSLDALLHYEGFPDTPEHATLLKKHLKR